MVAAVWSMIALFSLADTNKLGKNPWGRAYKITPTIALQTAHNPTLTFPASAAPEEFPAPNKFPTRAVPAIENPEGIMKENPLML
mmetsp:Transcript_12853/g.32373  ORF Transcript_12853/g.32373 Transcript_12853/m.32373 type:complete len:85 (+) Transcript_12853:1626-1880(+)